MDAHIVIEHNTAYVELGNVKDSAPIKNDSCATPLKKIQEKFGADIYQVIDSIIFHALQDGRTEIIQDIDVSPNLGIVGKYKGEQIGFTPIGKYNEHDFFQFGDANYYLLLKLGQKKYNKFEEHILKSVNNGKESGNFETLVQWEVVSELEYDKQQS